MGPLPHRSLWLRLSVSLLRLSEILGPTSTLLSVSGYKDLQDHLQYLFAPAAVVLEAPDAVPEIIDYSSSRDRWAELDQRVSTVMRLGLISNSTLCCGRMCSGERRAFWTTTTNFTCSFQIPRCRVNIGPLTKSFSIPTNTTHYSTMRSSTATSSARPS